jgi:hypothetical protein
MPPPVFISFASHDRKAAETILKAVELRGVECWIATRNIQPGENFQEAITRAIRSARVMILVFTSNANNSVEVKKEIALASQHNIVVVPVRLEDVVPSDALSYELAVRQWIDLFDDWESAIERLVSRIRGIVDADLRQPNTVSASPHPEATERRVVTSQRRRPTPLIAAIVGAGALIATIAAAFMFGTYQPSSTPQPTTERQNTGENPAAPQVDSFFYSTDGPMEVHVSQNGSVHGQYRQDRGHRRNGQLVGQLRGDSVIDGLWLQTESDQPCPYAREGTNSWGRFTIADARGPQPYGAWGYCDEPPNRSWNLQRR